MTSSPNSTPATGTPKLLLDDIGTYKFWRIQKRNAAKLLKEIIFRWRGASAFVVGTPGKWVVWPRDCWCEWTSLSRNQLDRALRELVDVGLINRGRHRFAGSEVRTFLQPTHLALKHAGKPQDLVGLIAPSPPAPLAGNAIDNPTEKLVIASTENIAAEANEKTGEKTAYTFLPSYSEKANLTNPLTELHMPKVSGVGGEDKKAANAKDLITILAEKKTKQIEDEKQLYPEKEGPHAKYVRHPAKMYPTWPQFSLQVKARLHAKYVQYVDNWYSGKKGREYTRFADWTQEDEDALIAAHNKRVKGRKNTS